MNRIQSIPTIECTGFTLRPFVMSDADALVKHINSSHIAERVSNVPHPYTFAHGLSWLESMRANRARIMDFFEVPERVDFAISVAGELVGSVAFIKIKGSIAQLSYWLSEEHQRKGIMTEVVRAVIKFGFEQCGLARIWAFTAVDNVASQGVLVKAGLSFEGVHRKSWSKNGVMLDSYVFAIVTE